MTRESSNGTPSKAIRTGSLKTFDQAAGATKNLRRFGQSIKRVVREVKEDNSTVAESRDVLVEQNNRLVTCTKVLSESYQIALAHLVTLHNKYIESKEIKNVFNRYGLLRDMIKKVVKLESEWWALVDIPKQNRAEGVQTYVLRVCSVINAIHLPSDIKTICKETKQEKDERQEKVNEMTSKQLYEENSVLCNTMYRLLKKYQAIRTIIHTLNHEYTDSKLYPMFPRYNFLKEMIKDVTHHPDYMEHRHESRVKPQ